MPISRVGKPSASLCVVAVYVLPFDFHNVNKLCCYMCSQVTRHQLRSRAARVSRRRMARCSSHHLASRLRHLTNSCQLSRIAVARLHSIVPNQSQSLAQEAFSRPVKSCRLFRIAVARSCSRILQSQWPEAAQRKLLQRGWMTSMSFGSTLKTNYSCRFVTAGCCSQPIVIY